MRVDRTLLLCMMVCAITFVGASEVRADLTVDDDGGADYTTIQEAVDNASPGEAIFVAPGLYVEEIVIPLSVNILGSGQGQTFVVPSTSRPGDGTGAKIDTTSWVFKVQADDVFISNLTILGDNPQIGGAIDARGGIITDYTAGSFSRLSVIGVEVRGVWYRGIYAAAAGTGHQFAENVVSDINARILDSCGIMFYDGHGLIRNNTAIRCAMAIGIQGGGGTVKDNVATFCGVGLLSIGNILPLEISDNRFLSCQQGIQSALANDPVSIVRNDVFEHSVGIALLGVGDSEFVIEENQIDGFANRDTLGVYISTDAGIYGLGDVRARINKNTFTQNEAAILINERPSDTSALVDVQVSGALEDKNVFEGSLGFDLFLAYCDDDIEASYNQWSSVNPTMIEQGIWHQPDDNSLGTVNFDPPVNLYLTVDDDGGADFTNIQPAIDAALPGATIDVAAGFYLEDLLVDRPLILRGVGGDADPNVGTIVRSTGGAPTQSVIAVTADDVTLEGLRVDGYIDAGDHLIEWGVYGALISSLMVTDCVIDNAVTCLEYAQSSDGLFLRNECSTYGRGFDLGGGILINGADAQVGMIGHGNYIHEGFAPGIAYVAGSSGTADGNRIRNVALGFLLSECAATTTLRGNEITDTNIGIQTLDNTVPINLEGTLALSCDVSFSLYSSSDVQCRRNYVDGQGNGLTGLFVSTHPERGPAPVSVTCEGNAFVGCLYGVYLEETASSAAQVLSCDLGGQSDSNLFAVNTFYDIYLQNCDDDVDATSNQFVTTDTQEIESRIWHDVDDPALGVVSTAGFLDYGPELRVDGAIEGDAKVSLTHVGLPGQIFYTFVAYGVGTVPTPFGDLLLDPTTLRVVLVGSTTPQGISRIQATVRGEFPPGIDIYFQAIVTDNSPEGASVTNRAHIATR